MKPETPQQTMRRMILETLRDLGQCHNGGGDGESDHDLEDVVEAAYKQARVPYDWNLFATTLRGLISGRVVKLIKGKWEDEEDYVLIKKPVKVKGERSLLPEPT